MSELLNGSTRWDEVAELLRQSQTMATAGLFAANVMHDLNGPLEATMNLAYLIEENADNPSAVRRYVRLQQEQLDNLAQVAQQTLEFYRSPGRVKAVDLKGVADAALRVHEHKFRAKQLRIDTVLPSGTMVLAHPGELLQVVSNLIANALDALPISGSLSIRVRKCSTEAHITIVDNGHGIPDYLLKQVFEPFFTTKRDRGTGLGLAISKSIVERHHGRLRARSSIRQGRSGTAFRVSLPLELPAADKQTLANSNKTLVE